MTDLPPWPGPLTAQSTWSDVYDRLLREQAERNKRAAKKKPPLPISGAQRAGQKGASSK